MTRATSRRAVIGGIAAAPVLSASAMATASQSVDPIFVAIERHRTAFMLMHQTGQVVSETRDDDVSKPAAEIAENEAISAFDKISQELIILACDASPAGIVELISYALCFNRGAFAFDPAYGYSMPIHWPDVEEFKDDDDDGHGGASFAWALLDSIRENLASKAVQS